MVSPSGNVVLNGNPLGSGSAVAVGDRIQTGNDSSATITARGLMASEAANSSTVYDGTTMALDAGTIAVTTSAGVDTTAGKLTITPAQGSNRYEVTRVNCRVTVVVREGQVSVSDGSTLNTGQSRTYPEPDCLANVVPPGQNGPMGAPVPAAGAAGVSKTELLAVAGAAAVAAGIAAYLSIGSPTPISAQKPH
jgi:hypothetical protein